MILSYLTVPFSFFIKNQINNTLGRLSHLRIEADSLLRISQISQMQITSIRETLNGYYVQLRYNDSLVHEGNLGVTQTICAAAAVCVPTITVSLI